MVKTPEYPTTEVSLLAMTLIIALVVGVLETDQFETEPLVAPVAVLEYKRLQVNPLSNESET